MSRRASSSTATLSGTTPLAGLLLLAALLCISTSSWPASARQGASSGTANAVVQRSVTVTFNYDFGKNPSCAEKPALKKCVKQFVVYDSSVGKVQLFTIPVPQGAHGLVNGITGQSPVLPFIPGRHRIAVTAQDAAGVESAISGAIFIVDVKPN